MSTETRILIMLWAVSIGALFFLVPREKIRDAHIIFLFVQTLTWFNETVNVQLQRIEFPVREFMHASQTAFTPHFIVYPTYGVLFCLFYPTRLGVIKKFLYLLLASLLISTFHLTMEKFTPLVHHLKADALSVLLTSMVILFITQRFYFWFQKGLRAPRR